MALSQKQLSERKNFIGSSEAKIIANGSFSDWAKLISEKKGEQERLVTKQLQFLFDTGNYMEPFVLDNFKRYQAYRSNKETLVVLLTIEELQYIQLMTVSPQMATQ